MIILFLLIVLIQALIGYLQIRSRGLITKYGGMGSHMAIRCAELNIPAAIGCGHKIFDSIPKHLLLTLNCYEGKISTDSKYEIFN